MLLQSGLVLNEDVVWIAFHSGYDFGYFIKSLIGGHLPDNEESFYQLTRTFFPVVYDIKWGLDKIAD